MNTRLGHQPTSRRRVRHGGTVRAATAAVCARPPPGNSPCPDALRKVAKPAENLWGMQLAIAHTNWLPFVWGWGGDRWTPDFKKSTIDQPGAIEGLQFYVDLVHRHQVAPPL